MQGPQGRGRAGTRDKAQGGGQEKRSWSVAPYKCGRSVPKSSNFGQ